MNRTVLAFLALPVVLGPPVLLAKSLGVGSWGMTAIVVAAMFVVSLIDREGFYGANDPPPPPRS